MMPKYITDVEKEVALLLIIEAMGATEGILFRDARQREGLAWEAG